MTISSENVQNVYSGNDSTTIFAYSFKIINEDHLDVVIADADDTQTTLTISTHYSVSGVGVVGGGNVTLGDLTSICGQATLPTGWTLAITRAVTLLQETDFDNQGGFFAENHEDAFDYLTMITQQLQEQLDRCPKVSETSGLTGDEYLTDINAAVVAAQTAQANAETAETNAETAETNAAASAAAASTSETNAATSETNAAASETAAATSETNAATSETNAAASETAAETAETNAETAETNAETAETNSAASAAAASTSETNAATSETNAATSETNAATSETNAATSETNAATSETNAAASLAAAGLPGSIAGEAGKMLEVNSGETAYQFIDNTLYFPGLLYNVGLSIVMSANAVTVALKQRDGSSDPTSALPAKIGIRHGTITTGGYNVRSVESALSMTIDSGATLGTESAKPERIYIYAIDNSGTIELAASYFKFKENELVSTTLLDSSADDPNTIYSDTARASVPVRLLGSFLSTQATAGTWVTAAAEVYIGGKDLEMMEAHYSTDSGQSIPNLTWTDVVFEDKISDSHGIVNVSNGRITPGISGTFFLYSFINFATAAWPIDTGPSLAIFKNGSIFKNIGQETKDAARTQIAATSGGIQITLKETDYITVRAFHVAGAARSLYGASAYQNSSLYFHRIS